MGEHWSYCLMHHGILGQKWGVRNGPPYPLTEASTAKIVYQNAKQRIATITKDVTLAAKHSGSRMYGLQNRLKTEDSIARKINKNYIEKNESKLTAANNIKDAIRFTTISSEKDFVNNYEKMKSELESKGYSETRCKNYFDLFNRGKVKHKSVQSTYSTKDGYEFEIQFHTPASQDAKNKKIPLYEERRTVGISAQRAKEIERKMENLAIAVPDPINIERIKTHE